MFGLSARDWEILNSECILPLKASGAKVWIFGSRARGDHRRYSDVDVLYESASPLGSPLLRIKEHLEESRISIKVDIVSEVDLAQGHRISVLRDRILV